MSLPAGRTSLTRGDLVLVVQLLREEIARRKADGLAPGSVGRMLDALKEVGGPTWAQIEGVVEMSW